MSSASLLPLVEIASGDPATSKWWHANNKLGSAGQALVKQLGKQRINNLFSHLRKIAQHPLLVRNLFTEAQVERLVTIAHQRWVSNACWPPKKCHCITAVLIKETCPLPLQCCACIAKFGVQPLCLQHPSGCCC